ncbi:MAG: HAD family hydrolase [Acidimicrobiales bacterium]
MSFKGLASDDPTAAATSHPSPSPSDADCWVFDVDGCLVDSLTGSSLRPGARELLDHLALRGTLVLLWSAGGDAYARARAEAFGVDHLVGGFFAKDGRDPEGFYLTAHLPLPPARSSTVFVDDRPEDLSRSLAVIAVSPYLSDDSFDKGLSTAARRAGLGWPTSGAPNRVHPSPPPATGSTSRSGT